ncbi:MAG: sulfite exporter TauE/SafE family protein [Flavobacteriales bacterium]
MNPTIVGAFILGIAGSAHCIGMCGPIALAVPSVGRGWPGRLGNTVILNSGRLVTYILLGAAFGAFGRGLELIGLQRWVSIIGGSLLLISVVLPGVARKFDPSGNIGMRISRVKGLLARNLRRTSAEALFFTGVLNGLLPCGLVYAAAMIAAVSGSVTHGILTMLLFGLGTWPALIALRMSGALLGVRARKVLRTAAPAVLACVALLMILRGAGLDIPMISPVLNSGPVSITACH